MQPLEGITVLDLTSFLPGAVATMSLLRFGAEVIKLERPGKGDPARHLIDHGLFTETNRGKKSIVLDLKDPAGRALFSRIAEKADVLVESFRPGVMHRLGLDHESLLQINPRLIYSSLTGYGLHGPYSSFAGHDINYMALSGVLDLLYANPATSPQVPQIQIADVVGGANQLLIGILLALQARHHTGLGQKVEACMFTGMSDLLTLPLASRGGSGPLLGREDRLSGAYACYALYRCKDDRWIAVGALESQFWLNLCTALDCTDLIDHQFSPGPRQSEMKAVLANRFAGRAADEWFSLLGDRNCCITPVRRFQEAMQNGYFDGHQVGVSVALNRTPGDMTLRPSPLLGEHTAELLQRIGIGDKRIEELRVAGVIGCGHADTDIQSRSRI